MEGERPDPRPPAGGLYQCLLGKAQVDSRLGASVKGRWPPGDTPGSHLIVAAVAVQPLAWSVPACDIPAIQTQVGCWLAATRGESYPAPARTPAPTQQEEKGKFNFQKGPQSHLYSPRIGQILLLCRGWFFNFRKGPRAHLSLHSNN